MPHPVWHRERANTQTWFGFTVTVHMWGTTHPWARERGARHRAREGKMPSLPGEM